MSLNDNYTYLKIIYNILKSTFNIYLCNRKN